MPLIPHPSYSFRPSSLKGLPALRPFRPRGKKAASATPFPLGGGLVWRSLQTRLSFELGLSQFIPRLSLQQREREDTWTGTLSHWPGVGTPLNKTWSYYTTYYYYILQALYSNTFNQVHIHIIQLLFKIPSCYTDVIQQRIYFVYKVWFNFRCSY